jgi:outer membrane protein
MPPAFQLSPEICVITSLYRHCCSHRELNNFTIMFTEPSKGRKRFPASILFSLSIILSAPLTSKAQQQSDSLLQEATLPNVIGYAIKHQPAIEQSRIDERITEFQIKSKLADWYPQVNFNYIYQHNFQVQTSIIGGNPVKLGVDNVSALQFTASQAIFNRDVLLASRTKNDVRTQAKQQTEGTSIDVAVSVAKAFYDVLTTEQQIKVVDENIIRLERSLKDARAQYDAGVVDKTDYKRATIALNNSRAARRINEEALRAKMEYLKALMNYPASGQLNIVYDSLRLEQETVLDTLQHVDFTKRVEYRALQTQVRLQDANLRYNRWSFLPTLSANGAYIANYLNNSFSKLYAQSFPQSYAGLTLAFPIFQGGKRKFDIRRAELQVDRTNLELVNLKNTINAEYLAALAGYKGSLANYYALKENVMLAQEVYDVVQLQYRSGIKTYLEVVTAESDLRTAKINYFNSLYQVLVSKIDAQKSLGDIRY